VRSPTGGEAAEIADKPASRSLRPKRLQSVADGNLVKKILPKVRMKEANAKQVLALYNPVR